MADKFIIHGAAFNGDGTTSAAAASDGAAGAWNNINVFEGTTPAYGTLGAGDTVFIRGKDASGADITRTQSASVSLGAAAATETAPIVWVFDNGTTWAGVTGGVLTYTKSASANNTIQLVNNHIIALDEDAIRIIHSSASVTAGHYLADLRSYTCNLLLDASAVTSTNVYYIHTGGNTSTQGNVVAENLHVRWGRIGFDIFPGTQYSGCAMTLINPDIELTNATVSGTYAVFATPGTGSDVLVLGGRVRGVGATTGQILCRGASAGSSSADFFRAVGFDVPRAMTISGQMNNGWRSRMSVELIGCDGGIGGHLERFWGFATSRTDNNPPYLAAYMPDSASTPWAWRVYPYWASSIAQVLLPVTKFYTGAAESKTLTQEILVATTMTLSKGNTWISVEYTDNATGLPKHVSSRVYTGAELDTSTADWSATVWGMISFNKRKLSVTTPTSIKPNTLITLAFFSIVRAADANDILFVDPDFGVN